MKSLLAACALAALPGLARAHVALSPSRADAGAYFAATFRVGHGCGAGAATTAIRIDIPAGIESARPRPVPGWRMTIDRDGDTVTAVTWRGKVADDQFEAFELLMKLPAKEGPIYFPVVQTCGKLQSAWIEAPGMGEAPGDLKRPAPRLDIGPAAPAAAGHQH